MLAETVRQCMRGIGLSDENAEIRFPQEFRIIREVTQDEEYSNYSLAKRR